jgi:isopenicillin-N N-acyltransferase-like protein
MRCRHFCSFVLIAQFGLLAPLARAQDSQPGARQILLNAITHWADVVENKTTAPPRTLVAQLKLVKSTGLPPQFDSTSVDLAFQAPDRLRISGSASDATLSVGRDRNDLWVDEPQKKFAVHGKPGVALFHAEPDRLDHTEIGPFTLPITRLKLAMIPYMLDVQQEHSETIGDAPCDVLRIGMLPAAVELFGVSSGHARLWLRHSDLLPLRLTFQDGRNIDIEIDAVLTYEEPWSDERWQLHATEGEHVETTAVSHLMKFLRVGPKILTEKVEPLGAPDGDRELVASEGRGRLETIDGTSVLFLKGSPEEMGHQQGVLLKKQAREICNHILYGFGIGSSFESGRWFFSEVERAEARLEPFMDKHYLAEMDALADATQMDRQEARLANFFPELFHCTGFALFGKATGDSHLYHGRVLDYLRGIGLEQNAVVVVYQPDYGNAWVNLGYAGFVGSVTAMNEKKLSIGEMGGEGYGNWDGKPMAELVREVMEKANTLDEAIRIMRDSPRTCHYYYVISDGKTRRAVAIEATADTFRVVKPGEAVPELPHAFEDAVLLSAGDRYETLVSRVKDRYGNFDARSARDLMFPPVCMKSNIQSVLFEPDTLDFWVANADSQHVASAARYTHYNLKKLLQSAPPKGTLESLRDRLGLN